MKVVAKVTKVVQGGRGRELQRRKEQVEHEYTNKEIPLILWGG